jgi:tetratricopeptide (TPR) repeat protein
MNVLMLTVALLGVSVFDEPFIEASQAFNAGDYEGAATRYERLITEGVTQAPVFYNLGNTYYRMGELGRAIANYERALHVDPGFQQAAYNIERAIDDTQRKLPRPLGPAWEQSLLFWHGGLRPRTTLLLAGIAWLSFWAIVALRTWRPYRYLRSVAVVLIILSALLAFSAWSKAHPPQLAVVSVKTAPVRNSTDESAPLRFELFDGDRVRLEETRGDWARVATANGERGWCAVESITVVGPPYPLADEDAS